MQDLGLHSSAIADYSQAIELNPWDPSSYFNRALAYTETGEHEQAIADYSKVIELAANHAAAYFNRGGSFALLGRHSSAAIDYGNVISLEPFNAAAYYRRARAFAEMGQHRKAISDYNMAIALRPGYIEATHFRGLSHWAVGERLQAIRDFAFGFLKDVVPWVSVYVEPQQQPIQLLRSVPRPALYRHRGIAHIQTQEPQSARPEYNTPLLPELARTRTDYSLGLVPDAYQSRQFAALEYDILGTQATLGTLVDHSYEIAP